MHGKMCVIILNYYKDFDQQHKTINNDGEKISLSSYSFINAGYFLAWKLDFLLS